MLECVGLSFGSDFPFFVGSALVLVRIFFGAIFLGTAVFLGAALGATAFLGAGVALGLAAAFVASGFAGSDFLAARAGTFLVGSDVSSFARLVSVGASFGGALRFIVKAADCGLLLHVKTLQTATTQQKLINDQGMRQTAPSRSKRRRGSRHARKMALR